MIWAIHSCTIRFQLMCMDGVFELGIMCSESKIGDAFKKPISGIMPRNFHKIRYCVLQCLSIHPRTPQNVFPKFASIHILSTLAVCTSHGLLGLLLFHWSYFRAIIKKSWHQIFVTYQETTFWKKSSNSKDLLNAWIFIGMSSTLTPVIFLLWRQLYISSKWLK